MILGVFLCILGIHDWSPWFTQILMRTHNLFLEQQARYCLRCGSEQIRRPVGD